MPSSSEKQRNFMAMASTAAGRAKLKSEGKKVPPKGVALEYRHADKGKHFKGKNIKKKAY